MINSRTKGASAERELAALLNTYFDSGARRNLEQVRSGGHDLELTGTLERFAIEVKRYRSVTDGKLSQWWEQALTQARDAGKLPMLAFRADRQRWKFIVPLEVACPGSDSGAWPELHLTAMLSIEGLVQVMNEIDNCDTIIK